MDRAAFFCAAKPDASLLNMLGDNPHPDEDAIGDGMAGNLCRRTGCHEIVAAIRTAAVG